MQADKSTDVTEWSRVSLERCPICGNLVPVGKPCRRCEGGNQAESPVSGSSGWAQRKWFPLVAIAAALVLIVGVGITVRALHQSHPQQQSTSASNETSLSLGELSSALPESEESSLLLALVTRQPGKTLYKIDYQVTGQTISLAYSLAADTLTREQRGSDGHGQRTVWQGEIMQRLQDSADGATLTDPAGNLSQPETESL